MPAELIPIIDQSPIDQLIEWALATCPSPLTRRMYGLQLRRFVASGLPLNREGVAMYLQTLRDAGKGSATVVSAHSAIRKLVTEARIRKLLSADAVAEILDITTGKRYKTRAGTWLTLEDVEGLLALPDRSTYWGKRDACILSCMVGCGFRREEFAQLKWSHYQSRDGRMCFVDFVGKGNKLRTLPVPTWTQADVDAWRNAIENEPRPPWPINLNHIHTFRPEYVSGGLRQSSIYAIVCRYGEQAGHELAPHDLRRTLAQLLRKAGAPLEQIQGTLGHESVATTMLYLGSKLELAAGEASVDQIKLSPVAAGKAGQCGGAREGRQSPDPAPTQYRGKGVRNAP